MPFDESPFGENPFDNGDTVQSANSGSTIDHVTAALARLPQQFIDQPNVIKVLTAFVQPMQALENAIATVIVERSVNNATGVTLQMLGNLVGQAKGNLTDDDDYRRLVRARIAANKSSGNVLDLLRVARLVLGAGGNVLIDQQGRAAYVARVTGMDLDDTTANSLLDFLSSATLAGVNTIVESQYVDDVDCWCFALATFAAGAQSSGATTVTVASTVGFPGTGALLLDQGTAYEETVTYTGIATGSFIGVSSLANNHDDTSEVKLATGPGLGMGDTSDDTVGGELSTARDTDYTM